MIIVNEREVTQNEKRWRNESNCPQSPRTKKRDKFNSVICDIEKTAEQGFCQCHTYFKKHNFTIKELQDFSDYLNSKGYDVTFGPSDGMTYIMSIQW